MKSKGRKDQFGMLGRNMLQITTDRPNQKMSISGMDSYIRKNPLKLHEDIISSKDYGDGITIEALRELLKDKTPEQKAHAIAGFLILDNVEDFKAELFELFNEHNLLNLLHKYKDETGLLAEALQEFKSQFKNILSKAAESPHLFGAMQFLVDTGVDINESLIPNSKTLLILW